MNWNRAAFLVCIVCLMGFGMTCILSIWGFFGSDNVLVIRTISTLLTVFLVSFGTAITGTVFGRFVK